MLLKYIDDENPEIQFDLDVPLTTAEYSFGKACDFKSGVYKLDALEKTDENIDEALSLLNAAIKVLVTGDIDQLPHSDATPDTPQETWDRTLQTKVGLYKHLLALPDREPPQDPTVSIIKGEVKQTKKKFLMSQRIKHRKEPGIYFTVQGEEYGINKARIEKMLGQRLLKTGEMIEALEYEKMGREQIERTKDIDFNIEFNMGLGTAAYMLRKRGEDLPVDKSEREAFLRERIELFKDIPYSIIVNVRSFFLATLIGYTRAQIVNSRLKTSSPLTLVRE